MRLACCQHAVEAGAIEANVERALAAIADAAADGADLVCLPEIFTVGYFAFDEYEWAAESLAGPTLSRVAATAREHGVGVLAGSIVEDLAASANDGFETPIDILPALKGEDSSGGGSDGLRRRTYGSLLLVRANLVGTRA